METADTITTGDISQEVVEEEVIDHTKTVVVTITTTITISMKITLKKKDHIKSKRGEAEAVEVDMTEEAVTKTTMITEATSKR